MTLFQACEPCLGRAFQNQGDGLSWTFVGHSPKSSATRNTIFDKLMKTLHIQALHNQEAVSCA